MKFVLISIVLLSYSFCLGQENRLTDQKEIITQDSTALLPEHTPLDTIIRRMIPLTIEGNKGILHYHLIVNDWHQPVQWKILFTVDSLVLLEKQSIDSLIDPFFEDTLYVLYCQNYVHCKQKWYLSDILKIKIDTISVHDQRRETFHRVSKLIASDFFTTKQDIMLVEQFWNDYQTKDFLAFTFYLDPVIVEIPLLTYYPKAKKLIPIYAP